MEVVLDKALEILVIHVATLKASVLIITVHFMRKSLLAALEQDKALKNILIKDSDFAKIFSFDLAIKLLDHMKIHKHAIKLVESKSSPYSPIYIPSLVKLEILKMYIETYVKTRFIPPSKSYTRTPILFDKKSERRLCLSVNY